MESILILLIMFKKLILLVFILVTQVSLAQGPKQTENKDIATDAEIEKLVDPTTEFEQIKMDRLKRIRNELVTMKSEINKTKKILEDENLDMVSKIQAESRLNSLEKEYEKKQFLFIETATNIHLNDDTKPKEKTTFLEDLQQILSPVLNSFKQISDRPREIQELQALSDAVEARYQEALKAQKRLAEFLKDNKDGSLKWKLRESIQKTDQLVEKLSIQREDLKFRIIKIESDQEPFIQTFSNVILDFFKTKGLHLFLALMIFIAVLWTLSIIRPKLMSVLLFQINRLEKRENYRWMLRPIRVIYNAFAMILAFLFGILTLYALNDWVLVTLILIIVAALVWSSKQYFPVFLAQSKIILNLGSIRENERVFFQGLPWEIKSLGYYCRLYNPVLSGGFLRVNTKDIMQLCSRRIVEGEPWFPTKTGDWVAIDGKYAKVILQSPEQVLLRTIGTEAIAYSASDFYAKNPINHSNGFCVEFLFGLDYSHQQVLFTEVIPNFTEEITATLEKKFINYKDNFEGLTIEFAQAGASSLDLRFFVKVKGSLASKKFMIKRAIQACFVEVCNEHNYIIPFNQLTVHMEK